ncbi:SusC/RagA family TonB-linked outer membrane protein [Algoriphagus machipongonensis]|uniref:Outer membrane protein, probably involved in nutrient binding n=1 Tax=Algoriphagus machipongonensis TaxID=388413 RepID=A3I019_9BACT|nr:SusC/RagA family TonB-linked outer membrane protein [Algoriphagus machipongonensis]EAZ80855.1 putative outer membrane protein, probably involved in nutrient binding [Algoriphagus machipongonensis]
MSKRFLLLILVKCLTLDVLLANPAKVQDKRMDEVYMSMHFQNATIEEAFKQIEAASGFNFVYTNKEIKGVPKVALQVNTNVFDALVTLSRQTKLEFRQINENIVVRKKDVYVPETAVVIEEAAAISVSGVVVDESNMPLPGVTIIEKGTTNGTVTDIDGNFSLEVNSSESILTFSFIGMESIEMAVGERRTFNITMLDDIQSLNEVVVIGYGTQTKKEITSAVANVSSEDFVQTGVRSPMELIQGKVAGLNIIRTQGSNPNAGTDIQLRGLTSVEGTTQPLIVIDGIPGGNLDLLQQDDIATFDVLKDGSAAAIYGTRGNAGVILITTKKGKSGQARFDYSTYFQREFVDRRPDNLTADEYRDLIDQGLVDEQNDFGTSTDLYDELINKENLSQYHNFAASGGSENSNYRVSFFFNDAEGIAKENSRKQYGGRMSFSQTGLQDRLTLATNMAVNLFDANRLGGGGGDFEQAIQRNPTAPIYNEDGSFVETEAYNNYNPLSRFANRISERKQLNLSGDVRLTLEIMEGLTASVFGAHQRRTYNDRYYQSMNDFANRPASQYQGTGYASKYNYINWNNTLEATVNYKRIFNLDHSLDVIGGYSYQYFTTETFNVNNSGFTTDGFLDWNLSAGSAINNTLLPRPGMDSFKDDNTLIAFFGRASYSYKDKYFAQATLRREGSSKFGENHKWGNFPAVSVGWALSEESFLSSSSTVNNLKMRLGYGVTGNQGIGNYLSLVTLGTGGVYPQEGVYYQTYGAARNPNPDLRWEKKKEWNLGFDFLLFNRKLTGSLDFYTRNTEDLLYNYTAQQPAFVKGSLFTNVGTINNRGIELYLSSQIMERGDFTWQMDLTANTQINEITSLSNDVFTVSWIETGGLPSPGNLGNAIRVEEGGAVGNFYGKKFAGFNEDGKWLFYKADGSTGTAGEMSQEDLTIIGNGVPKYMASLNNVFRYKGFDFTVFFRGKFDFDILNTKEMYFGNKRWLPNNLLSSAVNKHVELDDDPQYSDYYLENGSFVKLDNITLGYTFKVDGKYVKNLRVYAAGRNIATFTGYSGLDPELQDAGFTTGIDGRGFYPRTKSFTVGLNIGF